MNTNRKEIAHEKNDGQEVDYICNRYGLEKSIVENVMLSINGKGKYARSRRKVYAALIETGYMAKPIKNLHDIDLGATEGKLLVYAIGLLMTFHRDKTPRQVIAMLNKGVNKSDRKPKPPKQEQIFTEAEYFKP